MQFRTQNSKNRQDDRNSEDTKELSDFESLFVQPSCAARTTFCVTVLLLLPEGNPTKRMKKDFI